jgi:hypothetical protein
MGVGRPNDAGYEAVHKASSERVARLACIATLAMTMKRSGTILFILLASACAPQRPQTQALPSTSWRQIATSDDQERLRGWRGTFVEALATARRSGYANEIAREGALLQPDAALGGEPLPNGYYRCRVIKIGAKSDGQLDFIAYPAFQCRVRQSSTHQSFAKLTGSQRYIGRILPGDAMRQIFLGTLALGDETRALDYGADRERNVAGHIEKVGPARWRLVMPRPHFEWKLEVVELIPAT